MIICIVCRVCGNSDVECGAEGNLFHPSPCPGMCKRHSTMRLSPHRYQIPTRKLPFSVISPDIQNHQKDVFVCARYSNVRFAPNSPSVENFAVLGKCSCIWTSHTIPRHAIYMCMNYDYG